MADLLNTYSKEAGDRIIDQIHKLAKHLQGCKVVHVNSTRVGGGVAEILMKLIPLMNDIGIETSWEVITGEGKFYECTKGFHNGLQGNDVNISPDLLEAYEVTNAQNAEELRAVLEDADYVIIHDPQPAPFLTLCPNRKGKWIWRCHIDASNPHKPVWDYLTKYIAGYDASIFSLANFAKPLPHTQYLIAPSIDPLSDKNIELSDEEINSVYGEFNIDPDRPLMLQVSRYDWFKDPVGVIEAYKLVKKYTPGVQLVLAGGGADDDPEGEEVLSEVKKAAGSDPDIKILLLQPDAYKTINALQRAADIIFQKSTREGFGLTVTEGMWKQKPLIGGNTGGIRLQVINHHTGFLVNSPEGAALRAQYLLTHPTERKEMGLKAKEHVRDNFLITRHLKEYLSLFISVTRNSRSLIRL